MQICKLGCIKNLAILCSTLMSMVLAQTPNNMNNLAGFSNNDIYGSFSDVSVNLIECRLSDKDYTECSFTITSNYDGDRYIYFRKGDISAILSSGETFNSSKLSIKSYNNGEFTEGEFGTKISPSIAYKVIAQFKDISPINKSIRYLDIGWKQKKFIRFESITILSKQRPVTPLPSPQPALDPKQYQSFNATNGYGILSGVSLNGGLYDVYLQGCRLMDEGMAACTLTLTPMRATPQDVTLEDLNVAVNGAAVTATATATPTVMTLTVSAPVNVNRIDELRLGNAHFLNINVNRN